MNRERKEIKDILRELSVNPNYGVPESEVEERRKKFGVNKISSDKIRGFFWYFFEQFKNPLNIILILAGVLTLFLGEHLDTYVIFSAVLINVLISAFQEARTNRTFQILNKSKVFDVLVKRDAKKMLIPAEELVVGDIVFLQAGDKVPADLVIIESNTLSVDESSFTGEAESIEKKKGDSVYSGTIVRNGSAVGVCVAVGVNSKFGQILLKLNEIERKTSPLTEKMRRITMLIGSIAVFAIILVIGAGVYSGIPLYSLIVLGISVAVSAVPEGLAASVSAALSIGMYRLLKKGVLVKDLSSTEVMASVDTILTDKTGTLTEGDMTLKEVFLHTTLVKSDREFIIQAYLSSDASYDAKHNQFVGDEMDVAIANALESDDFFGNGFHQKIEEDYLVIKTFPFSSESKFFGKLVEERETGKRILFIKGAPEIILENASNLSREEVERYKGILRDKQDAETRFLAFGYKEMENIDLEEGGSFEVDLKGLSFTALAAFLDPLKKSVREVLQSVKDMDLNLVMVTGDSKEIASAVALKSGLVSGEDLHVLEGKDIEKMSIDELYEVSKTVKIFARVKPDDKLKLARAFVEHGHRIAMTGDGVNDVLALSQADIGITFANASEAARESASLVLKKNDFSLILDAIREARNVILNMRKTVIYLLSSSFSEVFAIFGSLLVGGPIPFLAVHILWANIVEEGLINFAFVFGKNRESKKEGRVNPRILTKRVKKMIALLSVFDGLFLLALYLLLWKLGLPASKIRSLMFLALSLNFVFIAYALTDLEKPIWKIDIFANRYLNFSVLVGIALIALAIFWNPMRTTLHIEVFSTAEILSLTLFAFMYLILVELLKYLIFSRKNRIQDEEY